MRPADARRFRTTAFRFAVRNRTARYYRGPASETIYEHNLADTRQRVERRDRRENERRCRPGSHCTPLAAHRAIR